MAKHGKITTFCLLLLFMILGSITMMLFLKNKGVEAKRENLKTVKNMIPPKIREEIKEVIDKCDKTIPEIKRKISDVLPAVENMIAEKAATDGLKEKREDSTKTLSEHNQNEAAMNIEVNTEKRVKENIFTSDLDEILESEVFQDDRENQNSLSYEDRIALKKMSPEVIQRELRYLYKKRMEVLTYLE